MSSTAFFMSTIAPCSMSRYMKQSECTINKRTAVDIGVSIVLCVARAKITRGHLLPRYHQQRCFTVLFLAYVHVAERVTSALSRR